MSDTLINELAKVLNAADEAFGTTGKDYAKLAQVDGTVVVPQNIQISPGALWVRREGGLPFQAVRLPSSGLTLDNTTPDLEVELGYPPGQTQGIDPISIIGLSPRGRREMGGMSPQDYGLLKAQNPQAENIVSLKLTMGSGGMKVGMTGGWFDRGSGLWKATTQADIADLTDSIPATAGQRRYVIVCWDRNANGAVVVERDLFDAESAYEFAAQIEGEIPLGLLHLGYVLLENGDTELDKNRIVPLLHLFQVPGMSESDRDPTENDASVAGFTKGWIWFNTTDNRLFMLFDSTPNAAVWKNISGGAGSEGNLFETLFVQGANHQIILDSNGWYAARYNGTGSGIQQVTLGARGNVGTPADSQQNDIIFQAIHRGYGSGERDAAKRTVEIIEATPGATAMGAKVQEWVTPEGSATPIPVLNWTGERVAADIPFKLPSLTEAERDALTPEPGWMVHNTDTDTPQEWDGATWLDLSTGGGGGSSADVHVVEGRLTLASGVPNSDTDITAVGTLYFTNYKGDHIRLYSSGAWAVYTFTEQSLSLSITSGNTYAVYGYMSGGTLALETGSWTDTATSLMLQDGVLVKDGDATRLYLGLVYATGTNQTSRSQAICGVSNYYNPLPHEMLVIETTNSWQWNSASWRSANGSTANRLQFVCASKDHPVIIDVKASVLNTFGQSGSVGIGIDSTSAVSLPQRHNEMDTNSGDSTVMFVQADYKGKFEGFHYAQWLEYARLNASGASGDPTFYGDKGLVTVQSGISALIWA